DQTLKLKGLKCPTASLLDGGTNPPQTAKQSAPSLLDDVEPSHITTTHHPTANPPNPRTKAPEQADKPPKNVPLTKAPSPKSEPKPQSLKCRHANSPTRRKQAKPPAYPFINTQQCQRAGQKRPEAMFMAPRPSCPEPPHRLRRPG
ncbi:MAG: hypothetical protein AAFS07_13925, partial [Pseudomonadota bacterium]